MAATAVSPSPTATKTSAFGRVFTFPLAVCFLIFIVVFSGRVELGIVESDIWWHLKNAQIMVDTHSLPHFDQFSFTAAGAPWIDHEWLSELIYYMGYRALGLTGLAIVFTATATLIFLSLFLLCLRSQANPKTSSIVLVLGVMLGSVNFGPRTLLFGWVAMTTLMLILQEWENRRSKLIYAVPALFCVWVNLHGSWLFGMGVLGLFIAGGVLEGEWGLIRAKRFTWSEFKTLGVVFGASAGALFVNPFGYHLVNYPFDMLFKQKSNMANIDEWRSIDFHDPRGKLFLLLLVLIIVSTLLSRRKWMLREVLLGLFALCSALTYWRMQYFAAIVFVPLIAQRLPLFPPYEKEKEKPWLNLAIIVFVVAFIGIKFPSEKKMNDLVSTVYPSKALAYMKANNITDRVLNEYGWGGYMIWHSPEIKTFIDGRADIYVYNGTFDDYVKMSKVEQTYELLDKYKVQYALVEKSGRQSYLLSHSSAWKQIYSDDTAELFARAH